MVFLLQNYKELYKVSHLTIAAYTFNAFDNFININLPLCDFFFVIFISAIECWQDYLLSKSFSSNRSSFHIVFKHKSICFEHSPLSLKHNQWYASCLVYVPMLIEVMDKHQNLMFHPFGVFSYNTAKGNLTIHFNFELTF